MLILSRKVGEQILVPQCGLSVTVVGVKGKTIRLAISAPAEIDVYRAEIWDRVRPRTEPVPALRSR